MVDDYSTASNCQYEVLNFGYTVLKFLQMLIRWHDVPRQRSPRITSLHT